MRFTSKNTKVPGFWLSVGGFIVYTVAMKPITDTQTLTDLCARLATEDFVTVDTEFMRESTYWPILCLVQVAGHDEAVAIDALAPGIDLAPLFDLMRDASVLKVFHAARQDLEIFQHLMGSLPTPIFDTQVAAMVCGFGDSVGYEGLIAKLTKARIDKSSRFTDWSARPLSERQIAYALSDVTHLRDAYRKLAKKLHDNNRESWVDSEMATLTSAETYTPDPNKVYRRIKVRNPKPRFLALLREVAAWRETEARRRNLVRNRILRDEQMTEIAHHAPKTPKDLERTRGLGAKFAHGEQGASLIEAIKRGLAVPDDECPSHKKKDSLPGGVGPATEFLKVLLKMKSEESGVAQKLLASSADLEQIAAFGEKADVPAMHGWRAEIFGTAALELCSGKTGLAIRNNNLVLVEAGSTVSQGSAEES